MDDQLDDRNWRRCLVCHRPLADPESKRRGIGPECARQVTPEHLAELKLREAIRAEQPPRRRRNGSPEVEDRLAHLAERIAQRRAERTAQLRAEANRCQRCGELAAGGCPHCEGCAAAIVDDEDQEQPVQRLRGFAPPGP